MRRRAIIFSLTIGSAVIAAGAAHGCRAVVTPPANVTTPTPVFIADYGRHASILLPVGGAHDAAADQPTAAYEYVEYGYGQWDWYALGRTEWHRAFAVTVLPSQGALGRAFWRFEQLDPSYIEHEMRLETVHTLHVEQDRAHALRRGLDARFAANAQTQVYNPLYGLDFVHDDDDYWVFHHCNTAVVRWLRQLECDVQGTPLEADFALKQPDAVASHSQ